MKQLSMRAKTIISFVLFAVVFTGLTLIASYCDLSISKILTKNTLPEGAYISTSVFTLFFEASGRKFEFPCDWGCDLQSEHERYLVEEHFKRPVILINYPKDIKAFYMKQNDDGKTVRAMDVLFPGIGEIIGGSEREADYGKLHARVAELGMNEKELWWYLDTRRWGSAPHSGFGLGFDRLLLFVTGMTNIRDVQPFPRTPKNADF